MTLGGPEFLVLGVVYTLLALLSPKAALFVLLPTFALAPETQVGGVALRPDDVMLGILAISWGFRRLGSAVRNPTALDQPLVWYFVVGLAATLFGAAIGTADLTSLSKYSASGLHLLKRLEFVLFFFILKDSVRSIADARRLVYVFMLSLAGLSFYSFGRFQESGTIAVGPSGSPIHEPGLASMLNVALALGFLVAPSQGAAKSGIALAVLLGSLYTLPFGLGRNYLAATVAMLVVVAFWRKRLVLILLPASALVMWFAGIVLYPSNVTARFLTLSTALAGSPEAGVQGVSLIDRFRPGFEHSWEVLTSSPILGWGLGSVSLGSIDSEYAGQLVYTGILGFVVFIWMIRRIARMGRETFDAARAQGSPALPLIAGLQHALLGYALYSTFSPSISAARAGGFFFTLLGLTAVLRREVFVKAESEVPAHSAGYDASLARPGGRTVEWTT
jgi:hypothetical protein